MRIALRVGAVVNPVYGYVILTSQLDGSWKDDWDGDVHTNCWDAVLVLLKARAALGAKHACLAELRFVG